MPTLVKFLFFGFLSSHTLFISSDSCFQAPRILELKMLIYFCAILLSDSVPYVCVLTARAARFTERSLSGAWRNKAIKESE